jgi:hypothetical protein
VLLCGRNLRSILDSLVRNIGVCGSLLLALARPTEVLLVLSGEARAAGRRGLSSTSTSDAYIEELRRVLPPHLVPPCRVRISHDCSPKAGGVCSSKAIDAGSTLVAISDWLVVFVRSVAGSGIWPRVTGCCAGVFGDRWTSTEDKDCSIAVPTTTLF